MLLGYPGGKGGAGLAKWIINQIPAHRVYLSPFLGLDAVLQLKRPAELSIGCEVDPATIRKWRDAAAGRDWPAELLERLQIRRCCGLAFLRSFFGLDVEVGQSPALGSVAALGGSAEVGGNAVAAGDVFVYADPPYLLQSRRNGRRYYRHEMTPAGHLRLLRLLKRLPCRVMISGYFSKLYDVELGGRWRRADFRTTTRGGPAVESVWMNYDAPAELHDYRFLGRDRRKRQDWRKRVTSFRRKLREMTPVERRALVAELRDVLPAGMAIDG